ncbi:MAG: TetR/AcrR family transcriptional regulator C-terminal domain-containing protein [Lachnospiraceae bacterium]|jgi:AcrR family transcriptional regulator|nr:TetR/AcrR family transcriptional regulator C-terminal domain-containing protein [Lachnospiraceae bacterium]
MKELKENRKTRYTQMVLKDSLMELMKIKPISKITIKELCEKADINRTTFYAHYCDQHQLLKSIEDENLTWAKMAIAGFYGKTSKEDFTSNIEKIFDYLIENRNHIQILMSEQGNIEFQRNLLSVIYEQCGIWLANDLNMDIEKNELYFVFLVNGSVGLIQHWLKNGLKESASEMAEIIYQMAYPQMKTA